jgi:hypothetical protein
MKNLLILHLESISRPRLAAFDGAFPNLRRVMGEALVFDNFFSSATSTLMVATYLFHGNDFQFDTATEFEGMRPEGPRRRARPRVRSAASLANRRGRARRFLRALTAGRPLE